MHSQRPITNQLPSQPASQLAAARCIEHSSHTMPIMQLCSHFFTNTQQATYSPYPTLAVATADAAGILTP
jgi:hypothetical protein